MNTTFMHLSIQLAQIRKFRIRRTFHFLDILGPAVEWSEPLDGVYVTLNTV